jgi:hypothetical protein
VECAKLREKSAVHLKERLVTIMRIWSASAIDRYYLDPTIEFLQIQDRDALKPSGPGYYIVPHCDPDCCQAFGGVSIIDFGPFPTRVKARKWSRENLVQPGDRLH